MKEKKNILWYFTLFSILGLIVETLYCNFTTGTWESRKGLLIGPFCPIYGIGAVVLILMLNKYKDKNIKLFVLGAFLGTVVEYLLSYALEAVYGNRFWDYSYTTYHINGRVSLIYSVFWGVLAIGLIKIAKPWIDKIIEKIKPSIEKKIQIGLLLFFMIDAILTIWSVSEYTKRAYQKYEGKQIEEKAIFPEEMMKKVFPNIRIKGEKGEEIWASTVQ